MAKKITKSTTVGEIVKRGDKYITVLQGFGMHCFGCPMSQMETLEEAGEAHEIDTELMITKLNEIK